LHPLRSFLWSQWGPFVFSIGAVHIHNPGQLIAPRNTSRSFPLGSHSFLPPTTTSRPRRFCVPPLGCFLNRVRCNPPEYNHSVGCPVACALGFLQLPNSFYPEFGFRCPLQPTKMRFGRDGFFSSSPPPLGCFSPRRQNHRPPRALPLRQIELH